MSKHMHELFQPLLRDNYWIFPGIVFGVLIGIIISLPYVGPIDRTITDVVRTLPSGLEPTMQVLSELASVHVTVGIIVVWFGILAIMRKWRFALTMLAAMSAMPLFGLLKFLVKRSRPDPDVIVAFGFANDSFPSGHATASAIVYLMIAYLAQRKLRRRWAVPVIGMAALLAIAVGISRVYLGFHFPTDVIAGWLVAVFVFLIVVRVASKQIEGEARQ